MQLPALRASAVIWLAAVLTACTGGSGQTTADAEPAPAATTDPAPAETAAVDPSVTFSATDTMVDAGATTTLTWQSEGTDSCSASGGWSGERPTSGSEATAAIAESTTFTLTCSGPQGNAMAMIEVAATGELSISWQPPTENVDGSPLTDLGGYTIYYGEDSGDYTQQARVEDPYATDFRVTLEQGEYYVAMTALDLEGNESALSNEVRKATL